MRNSVNQFGTENWPSKNFFFHPKELQLHLNHIKQQKCLHSQVWLDMFFFYSSKLSLPNASYFWSGNYTGQFCIQKNKWHRGNRCLNMFNIDSDIYGQLRTPAGWMDTCRHQFYRQTRMVKWRERDSCGGKREGAMTGKHFWKRTWRNEKRESGVYVRKDITNMVCNLSCSKQVLVK